MISSSSELSLAGMYNNFHASNIAYSSMIGQGDVFGRQGVAAEQLMGKGMGLIGGPGSTLATGAAGLMGWDPMSMGMKAAGRAWGGGASAFGAGAAGIGTMAGMGILGAGIGFVGDQMHQGMMQQQQVNATMRGFNFQNGQGGTGFNASQGGQVGSMMRSMTHELGSMGEMTSMKELTQMAGNMSRMGMANGVKSVEDFKDKFKQLVNTAKKMATDLGTTIEDAQKAMADMKRQGVMDLNSQSRMSGMMRQGALGTGMAMSEFAGMGSIGSQISRAIGGTGRQGAFGGVLAAQQVGSAMSTGALSEEDVYNATGQTGAEGRQAFAANMMSNSARFLQQRGRGRYFLASLAGKDGHLNEDSVQEWMNGGMDTGRTAQMAHQNLNGIGRANFIRNEGRLRGAVLEKFGGMAQSMAYKEWLGSRGYNPDEMDDRSMLAFQRFSGLGRDEADGAIKMVQALPEMMQQMRESKSLTASADRRAQQQSGQGLSGLKKKIDHHKEAITGAIQQFGADVYTDGTNMIESAIKSILDQHETRTTDGLAKAMTEIRRGGASGKESFGRMLGGVGANSALARNIGLSSGGGSSSNPALAASAALRGKIEAVQMREGGNSAISGYFSDAGNASAFRDLYTSNNAGGTSSERTASIIQHLRKQVDAGGPNSGQAKAMLEQMSDPAKREAIVASMEDAGGINGRVGIGSLLKEESDKLTRGMKDGGVFRTAADSDEQLGSYLRQGKTNDGSARSYAAKAAAGVVGSFMAFGEKLGNMAVGAYEGYEGASGADARELESNRVVGLLQGARKGAGGDVSNSKTAYTKLRDWLSGDREKNVAAGGFAQSEEGSRLLYGLAKGEGDAFLSAQDRIMGLRKDEKDGKLDPSGRAQLEVLQAGQVGSAFLGAGKDIDTMSDDEKRSLTKRAKDMTGKDWSIEEMRQAGIGMLKASKQVTDENRREAAKMMNEDTDIKREGLKNSGIATLKDGKLQLKGGTAGMDELSSHAADIAMKIANSRVGEDGTGMDEYNANYQALAKDISGMTAAQKKAFATKFRGTDFGLQAGESLQKERRMDGLMRSAGGNKGLAAARAMGLDMGSEEAEAFKNMSVDQQAERLAKMQDLTGKEEGFSAYTKQLKAGLGALGGKNGNGEAGEIFSDLKKGMSPEVAKKLQEAKSESDNPGLAAARKTAESTKEAAGTLKNMITILAAINDSTREAAKNNPEGSGQTSGKKP